MSKHTRAIQTAIAGTLVLFTVTAVGISFINHPTKGHAAATTKPESATSYQSIPTPSKQTKQPAGTDPSEGGKYLYVSEWGVRALLPEKYQAKTTYLVSDSTDPDTKLPLQAVYIYIASSAAPQPNQCELTHTSIGNAVTTASMILRSDNSKAFKSSRYNSHSNKVAADVIKISKYSFHVIDAPALCLGDQQNDYAPLQQALQSLQEVKR